MEIKINNKTYEVVLADTEESKAKGLQEVESMDNDEGMLFVYDEPQTVEFWMKDTTIPLDIIFINDNLEVISVKQGKPLSEDIITEDNVQFVLELNVNSGVTQGMSIDFKEDEVEEKLEEEKKEMKVLDSNGNIQMSLKGGERVFSRANTKTLISLSKKANESKSDDDFLKLGKKVFEFLHTQDNNEAEYV